MSARAKTIGILVETDYQTLKVWYPLLRLCENGYPVTVDRAVARGRWVDEECVVDGNLITAHTPDDLPAFMKALPAAL